MLTITFQEKVPECSLFFESQPVISAISNNPKIICSRCHQYAQDQEQIAGNINF